MPVITYTAVDRGRLASGHSATTSYQIECDFESFAEKMIQKGTFAETLNGAQEGYLDALQFEYSIASDLVFAADNEDWLEFFSSVANVETFQVDFTGTIASPGTDVDVALIPGSVQQRQVGGVGYRYSFRVRTVP